MQVTDQLILRVAGRQTVQPPVVVVEASCLVDRREDRELMDPRELEVLRAAARRNVHDAASLLERDSVPGNDAVLDPSDRRQVVERPLVAGADELRALDDPNRAGIRIARYGDPVSVLEQTVVGVRANGGRDVRRQRPRRGRPDDQCLAVPILERKANEERRIGLVEVVPGELVLGDGRSAPWAPLRRAVPTYEPTPLVYDSQKPPDVLDVRVREREVVVPPVHPHTETLRLLGDRLGRPGDLLAAAARELGEPVFLDLFLRVQPELALDADLHPEPLAVVAVLVALPEAS